MSRAGKQAVPGTKGFETTDREKCWRDCVRMGMGPRRACHCTGSHSVESSGPKYLGAYCQSAVLADYLTFLGEPSLAMKIGSGLREKDVLNIAANLNALRPRLSNDYR